MFSHMKFFEVIKANMFIVNAMIFEVILVIQVSVLSLYSAITICLIESDHINEPIVFV